MSWLREEAERARREIATWPEERQFQMWREATQIERGEGDLTPTPALRAAWERYRRTTRSTGFMESTA